MLRLRIDADPEVESVTRVWLGPLCVGVVLGLVPVRRVAPCIAAAFATFGQRSPRRLRRDAGPRGTKRWLEGSVRYFDDVDRRRGIACQLTPFIEAALEVYPRNGEE